MKKFNIMDLIDIMKNIEYGYVDRYGLKHYIIDKEYSSLYVLQSPIELKKSKLGVCWDQVEFERYFLENMKVSCETYFIVYYDNEKSPTHTFLVYEEKGKFIWFENAWEKHRGIHAFDSLKDLLVDIKNKFVINESIVNTNFDKLYMYKYNKPTYNISCTEFCKHCERGIKITI